MPLFTNKSYVDANVMLYGRNTYDTTTTPSSQVKIVASDAATDDLFGISVAIGSNRIVVGSPADDDDGTSSGSAYIYNLSGTQLKKIKAADASADAFFGGSVAIGSNRIVVGAYSEDRSTFSSLGAVYIFDMNGTQISKVISSNPTQNDNFGRYVAVGSGRILASTKDEGNTAPSSGAVDIFDLNGNRLSRIKASDFATNDEFGSPSSIGSGRIVVGSRFDDDLGSNSGSAYIFDLNGNQLAKIKASDGAADDGFGFSVSVGFGLIVVGAYQDDDNGSNSGSAYIFDLNGTQLAKIKPSDGAASDEFGGDVFVGEGRIFVSSAGDDDSDTNTGSVYVFNLSGTQIAKVKASDPISFNVFGSSIGASGGKLVVGAPSVGGGSTAGAAYIYDTPKQPHFLDLLDN